MKGAVRTGTFLALLGFSGGTAGIGGSVPGAPSSDLSDLPTDTIERRVEHIAERLEKRRVYAATWQYGWTSIFLGSIAYNAVKMGRDSDGEERVRYGVNIVKTGWGLFDQLYHPQPARLGAAPIRALSGDTRQDQLRRLRRAEALLAASAHQARQPYQIKRHLGILGLNALGGAVIWAFGESDDAVFSTVSGILGGELRLWSQVWRGQADWRSYKARYGSPVTGVQWRILPTWRGAVLEIRY